MPGRASKVAVRRSEVREPISLAFPLPPNVAMRYRLQDVRGYVIPTEERYFEIWRRVIAAANCGNSLQAPGYAAKITEFVEPHESFGEERQRPLVVASSRYW